MHQNGIRGKRLPGRDHIQGDRSGCLVGDGAIQEGPQPGRWIHHGVINRVAGDRQPGYRSAVSHAAVTPVPTLGPPDAGVFFGKLQPHRIGGGGAAAEGGHPNKALQMGKGEVGIALPHEPEAAIGKTPQPGGQAEIRSEAVEGERRADQLLVRGRRTRTGAVDIGQQAPTCIRHTHAPHLGLCTDHSRHPLLERWAADLGLQNGIRYSRWQRR